ncbi:MAG: RecX family transcriptional regulator [Bacteroidaceae bacterium]|nr:RecX family transcriptional regulator [Bacteroidaceae bacterium]
MRQWQISDEEQAKIMAQLTKYGFIDDERYARAYAEDKMKYNRWGARKVEMMLRRKGIDDDIISDAIAEFADEESTTETLRKLLEEKTRSLKNETDPYKKKQKLLRFAISRGFDYSDILDILEE